MIPGAIMGIVGFIIFLFLAPNPKDVGCIPPDPQVYRKIDAVNSSDEECGEDDEESNRNEAVSFISIPSTLLNNVNF